MKNLKVYNTLVHKKELFHPLRKDRVGLYTCGPTVYNYAHIGNLRTYIFEDVLRRTLEYARYKVKHVMNITDVGHLTSDEDEGEDKLERAAEKEKRSVWDIAKFYTDAFLRDLVSLDIKRAHVLSPATKNIKEEIAIIQELFKKGYAYETSHAVYFNISKFKNYTKLSRQKLSEKITGAREEVVVDPEKKHPQDFALWFKRVGRFENHIMHWHSPWGDGFPGWHIECSAISTKYLGQPFDIHTGGVDHINVHHTNEIAQSEGAYGKPLARIWMHGEFLLINEAKMAKSAGSFYTLHTLTEKNFSPLAVRYLVLTAHYRSKLNFTWESLKAAQNSLERLYDFVRNIKGSTSTSSGTKNDIVRAKLRTYLEKYRNKFEKTIFDDLNTPKALAVVWELIREYNKNPKKFPAKEVLTPLYDFDKVLGLGLKNIQSEKIPKKILALVKRREKLRKDQKWEDADKIREEIQQLGYTLEDTSQGTKVRNLIIRNLRFPIPSLQGNPRSRAAGNSLRD